MRVAAVLAPTSEATTPPTPGCIPLLGNGQGFSRAPFEAVEAWASHGNVVRVRFPGRSIYLVAGPDPIEEVLVEKRGRFTIGRDQREAFDGTEDDAVSAATGDRWARPWRALRPAFTPERIESYGRRMAERTAADVDEGDDGERIVLHGEIRRLTLRIFADTLLGTNVEGVLAATPAGGDDVRSVLLAARDRGELTTAEVEETSSGCCSQGTTPRPWRSPTRGTSCAVGRRPHSHSSPRSTGRSATPPRRPVLGPSGGVRSRIGTPPGRPPAQASSRSGDYGVP